MPFGIVRFRRGQAFANGQRLAPWVERVIEPVFIYRNVGALGQNGGVSVKQDRVVRTALEQVG